MEPTTRLVTVRGIPFSLQTAGTGPGLLLLHGFTGSSATWAAFLPEWSTQYQVLAPDLIGHGQSAAPTDPARYTLEEAVDDLLALLDTLGIDQCIVLGYSLGGRLALTFAVHAPARVSALILESTSPGIADPSERAARKAQDEALAAMIEERGIAWFVEYWEQQPLFASQARLPADVRARIRAERLAQRPSGLAHSLRGMGTGVMTPLWDHLPQLDLPVLLIVGAFDTKYVTIGQSMAAQLPHAELVIVPDAGHAVHVEQPEIFQNLVSTFLQRVTSPR
ncbi:2-succinyl-6-hydroxy-2,4-cyclohexadiene-1-carboxylate synthase [Thermorudis peleae]|uniref:2-succinyl-6-hydroxy-2, 4-cyclohexadiene-1-carboxylate synthase n=1 Tax=Thermorudis peleae TaxID=1382356 RepID=UPI00056EAEF8|nr:2-succinyl-6-hydroxy-2,4-cyclohexadiene-1-carboxylate synthase [Thermorudis peleae]MBX6753955.1 2-succinyl-6-hydroxy-2,4-cyclohexadiene-1-carboxylate synthase [Thermorudis peleae]